MTCHACWLNDLRKTPCFQDMHRRFDVDLPSTLTLRCYAVMTAYWSAPDGRVILEGLITGIPVTRNNLTKAEPLRESIAHNLRYLTEDLGELNEIAKLAQEILPPKIPWSARSPKRRVITLTRRSILKHAPVVLDDGSGWKRYQKDVDDVLKYGKPMLIQSWDQWFSLRKAKQRKESHGERKKSDRGT